MEKVVLLALIFVFFLSGCNEEKKRIDTNKFIEYGKDSAINNKSKENNVLNSAKSIMPYIKPYRAFKTSVTGYYELHTARGIIYYNPKTEQAIVGDLFDLKSERNLTSTSRAFLELEDNVTDAYYKKEKPFGGLYYVSKRKQDSSKIKQTTENNKVDNNNEEKINEIRQALKKRIADISNENKRVKKNKLIQKQAPKQNNLKAFVHRNGKFLHKIGYNLGGNPISKKEKTLQIKNMVTKIASDEDKFISYKPEGESLGDIVVFSDFSCPYCKKFHKEIPKLNEAGISVHYAFFQRSTSGGKNSYRYKNEIEQLKNVWCSENQQESLDILYSGKIVPTMSCTEEQLKTFPAEYHYLLGEISGVRATPSMLDSNGKQINGFFTAKQYINRMNVNDDK